MYRVLARHTDRREPCLCFCLVRHSHESGGSPLPRKGKTSTTQPLETLEFGLPILKEKYFAFLPIPQTRYNKQIAR